MKATRGMQPPRSDAYLPRAEVLAAPTRRARLEEFSGRAVLDMELAARETFNFPSELFEEGSR
jgi:hypothetical protein